MSTLSIVIPTYNMAPWLPVALESCLWQTHEDIDVIVVNDGSTDGSRAIAEAYARHDSRIRCLNQANAGPGAARQLGQDAAKGDFVTWLDADDFLDATAAAAWMEVADRDNVDMVCGNAIAFSNRTFNARRYFYHPAASCLHFVSSPDYWKSKVLWRWVFSLPFLRREGLVHSHFRRAQDVVFMYAAISRAASFSQTDAFVYYFRQDHKKAGSALDVTVEHIMGHFIEVRKQLLDPRWGETLRKPLIKYLDENYWRNIRKLAPLLTDEKYLNRTLELGCTLFRGLKPEWFRQADLGPELKEVPEFLPLVDALIAADMDKARSIVRGLQVNPPHAVDKNTAFHVWRHKIKALFNPLSHMAKSRLRQLETRAAQRLKDPAFANQTSR